jgi:hypothetical protein
VTLSDLKIKRMVDWEWCSPMTELLPGKHGVMRCYETEDGRLYRVDTLELWIPTGEYKFRGEVPMTQRAGGGRALGE